MSINFENKEARTEYLNHKLDNLLSGINSTYGQALLDELIVRLTRTISDFNEEVEKIMGSEPRKIDKIEINIFFKKKFDKKSKLKLESAALTCPVSNSLNVSLKKYINFIYP